jgi:hypothetical protein
MSKRVLTKAKFKAWLESKHPRTKVGEPGTCNDCPLAKFLTQTTGAYCEVDSGVYYTKGNYLQLPNWCDLFIDRVDNCQTEFLTAKKCLELLKAA